MTYIKFILKKLYIEEIITVVFLLLVWCLYFIFHKQFNILTAFTFWTLPIILIFLAFKIIITDLVKPLIRGKKGEDSSTLKEIFNFVRLYIPIIVLINIYGYLYFLIDKINPKVVDLMLIKIDQFLFFGRNPVLMMENFITPTRTVWFSVAYLSYYFYFPITFGALFIAKKIKEFHILSLVIVLIAYLGFIGYVIMPAVGPQHAQQDIFSKDLLGQPIAKFTFDLIDTYRYDKDTFPSLHTAMSSAFLLFSFKYLRKLFYVYLPFVISLIISTVYLRQHYVVDLIAGLILSLFALYISPKIYEWWEKKKSPPAFSTQAEKS